MVGAEAASPQPTVPSAASMRTSRFCAAVMVSADIFIGVFSGSATGAMSQWLPLPVCSRSLSAAVIASAE